MQKMQNYAQICTFETLDKSMVPSIPKNVFTIYFIIEGPFNSIYCKL